MTPTVRPFLETVAFWLASARDEEVIALAALVAAEQARRGLAPAPGL